MKPGTISSRPPIRIKAPSITSRPGERPAATAALRRLHAAPPCERSAQAPRGQLKINSRTGVQRADCVGHADRHEQLCEQPDDRDENEDHGPKKASGSLGPPTTMGFRLAMGR